jgi:hypothetical protein
MRLLLRTFETIHAVMATLFGVGALVLVAMATALGWRACMAGMSLQSAQAVIEAIGLLAAAVVALQIAQTILEEEVLRDAHISAPTRVRRFLSRFMVVLLVALTIEGLVASFRAVHEDLADLAPVAMMIAATGILLAAWGVFIRLNRAAEELEPDAMEDAKREDDKFRVERAAE